MADPREKESSTIARERKTFSMKANSMENQMVEAKLSTTRESMNMKEISKIQRLQAKVDSKTTRKDMSLTANGKIPKCIKET